MIMVQALQWHLLKLMLYVCGYRLFSLANDSKQFTHLKLSDEDMLLKVLEAFFNQEIRRGSNQLNGKFGAYRTQNSDKRERLDECVHLADTVEGHVDLLPEVMLHLSPQLLLLLTQVSQSLLHHHHHHPSGSA